MQIRVTITARPPLPFPSFHILSFLVLVATKNLCISSCVHLSVSPPVGTVYILCLPVASVRQSFLSFCVKLHPISPLNPAVEGDHSGGWGRSRRSSSWNHRRRGQVLRLPDPAQGQSSQEASQGEGDNELRLRWYPFTHNEIVALPMRCFIRFRFQPQLFSAF